MKQMIEMDSVMNAQIDKIIEHYGSDKQRMKACEELAELQVEIFHLAPESDCSAYNIINMTSEIADVYIMLEQILRIYRINNRSVKIKMIEKLRRTEDRIMADE